MDPVTGMMVAQGISGLLGLGGSAASGKYALQAQREANAMNYKIFQETNDWNEKMWNMENDYNTASAQRQRLEAAGLNPYLMMDGGNAGNANSAPKASPIQMQPEDGMSQGLQNMANIASQIPLTIAQSLNLTANTQKTEQETKNTNTMFPLLMQYQQLLNDSQGYKVKQDEQSLYNIVRQGFILDNDLLSRNNALYEATATAEQRINQSFLQSEIMAKQVEQQSLQLRQMYIDNCFREEELKWLPDFKRQELNLIVAKIETEAAQQNYSYEMAKYAVANRMKTWAEKEGVDLNNKMLKKQMPFIISKSKYEARRAYWEANEQKFKAQTEKYTALTKALEYSDMYHGNYTDTDKSLRGMYGNDDPWNKYFNKPWNRATEMLNPLKGLIRF